MSVRPGKEQFTLISRYLNVPLAILLSFGVIPVGVFAPVRLLDGHGCCNSPYPECLLLAVILSSTSAGVAAVSLLGFSGALALPKSSTTPTSQYTAATYNAGLSATSQLPRKAEWLIGLIKSSSKRELPRIIKATLTAIISTSQSNETNQGRESSLVSEGIEAEVPKAGRIPNNVGVANYKRIILLSLLLNSID